MTGDQEVSALSPKCTPSNLQLACSLSAVFFVRLHVRWGEGRWLGVGRERRLRYRGLRKSLRCRIAERTIKFRQKGASRGEGFSMPLLFLSAASLKISRSRLHADPHAVAGTSFQTAFRRFSNPFFWKRKSLPSANFCRRLDLQGRRTRRLSTVMQSRSNDSVNLLEIISAYL